LISLRKRTPSLHSRQWEPLRVYSEQQVYAYLRYAGPSEPPALVVLNFTPGEARAQIVIPKRLAEKFPAFAQEGSLKDVLRGEQVKITKGRMGGIRVKTPASSARILMEAKGGKAPRKKAR
jgi:hypothetical protein